MNKYQSDRDIKKEGGNVMASYKFHEERQRWVIRYYDQNGHRGWESMPQGTSAREAKKRAREVEDSIEKKLFKRPKQIPTFQAVASEWLQAKSANVRHTTLAQYKGHIDNYLNPFFGNIKTNEITLELVERFISERTKAGMFPNTIRKVVTTLSSIMAFASHPKRNFAFFNPVGYAENRPRPVKKEAETATVDEVVAVVDEMKHTRDKLIVLLMATTGCRAGEIFGLKWEDVQWKDNQIFIKRTYNHQRFYEPKSKRSRRTIDLPEELLLELRKWKLASPVSESDLILPTSVGTPEDESRWLRRIWHPARRRAGIRHLTPHAIRHLSGSLLLDQGETPGYVQDHMGHSSIEMTMDVYRHKLRKQNREAAEKIGKTFFGPNGCKMGANRLKHEKSTQAKMT
jgi:integrase